MPVDTVRIAQDAVVAEVAPRRGGMVTRLAVGGEELLYMDAATLEDPEKKVRGGIPVLFPIAGRLPDDRYTLDGKTYELHQHGTARDAAWDTVAMDARSIELRYKSDEQTLARFPFRFEVRLRYRASGNTLTVEQTYANLGERPMPLHVGFHPYFVVPDGEKRRTTLSTDATRAFDHVQKKEVPLVGAIDLTQPEVNLQLLDHGPREMRLTRPGKRPIRLTWDAPLGHPVIWTLGGKDFVCVEPWSGPAGALATGQGLAHVGPRETRKTFFAITSME